jgi:hypothetical protein
VAEKSVTQNKMAESSIDETMDESVELIEEFTGFTRLASSVAKRRRKGPLWGAV